MKRIIGFVFVLFFLLFFIKPTTAQAVSPSFVDTPTITYCQTTTIDYDVTFQWGAPSFAGNYTYDVEYTTNNGASYTTITDISGTQKTITLSNTQRISGGDIGSAVRACTPGIPGITTRTCGNWLFAGDASYACSCTHNCSDTCDSSGFLSNASCPTGSGGSKCCVNVSGGGGGNLPACPYFCDTTCSGVDKSGQYSCGSGGVCCQRAGTCSILGDNCSFPTNCCDYSAGASCIGTQSDLQNGKGTCQICAFEGESCGAGKGCCLSSDSCQSGKCVAGTGGLLPNPCGNYDSICNLIVTAFGPISTSPEGFTNSILKLILSISGGILVILIIISAYRMMTSQGDPEKIKQGRERLTSAVIGLLFIIFSFVFYQLITSSVLNLPGFK